MDPALINKQGYKFGFINGLLGILLLYGSWQMGMDSFVTVQIWSVFTPYMFAILVFGGLQLRKNNQGYISFKEALKYAFLAYVISSVLVAIATYILYNNLDKTLAERSFHAVLEKTRLLMEKQGRTADEINVAMTSAQKNKPVTDFRNVFLGLGTDLVLAFMKSLAVTLLIRKEKPVSFDL
jgi:hypothetical protein